jgi:hypothetical protein
MLKSITIPDSVKYIGDHAFNACKNLKSITIPSAVTKIWENAFCGCGGLDSIIVENGNTAYYDDENCLIEKNTKKLILGCQNSVIPNDIKSIGHDAFRNCDGLKKIVIPKSVEKIKNDAIIRCNGLEIIKVEKGNKRYYDKGNCLIENDGKRIIAGCNSSIIPNDIKIISSGAFAGHRDLVKIAIPSSVEKIERWAFNNCDKLESIIVDKNNVKYYSEGNCLIEKDTKTLIAKSKNNAIPNDIESIADCALLGCHELRSITIPNSVKKIEKGAFNSCDNLDSIIVEAIEPPVFYGTYPWAFRNYKTPVYVPKESIDAYKAANEWKELKNITTIEDKR